VYWVRWHLVIKTDWLTVKKPSSNCSTTYYGCEDVVEFNREVAWTGLTITIIHPQVVQESKINWLLPTLPITEWMDCSQACHGSFMAIPLLDAVDVENAYSYSASHHHCIQEHVRSYGCHYVNFSQEDDPMEGILILCSEVCTPEAVQILY